MLITRKSQLTGIEHTLDLNVTEQEILQYMSGVLVQRAFPHLSAAEREFIHSGITPEEWDKYITVPGSQEY